MSESEVLEIMRCAIYYKPEECRRTFVNSPELKDGAWIVGEAKDYLICDLDHSKQRILATRDCLSW